MRSSATSSAPAGPCSVRRVVVVGEVVRDEVEAVTRDEPARDGCRVRVSRARGATTNGERGAGVVGLEQPVVEEPLRPVRRLRHPRERRHVAGRSAIARDVHRGGDEACILDGLVHGRGTAREMLVVHVVDRVRERLREPGCAYRGERRAVLDDATLLAVPPDEMRNVVDIGSCARRDRRQAHRRQ